MGNFTVLVPFFNGHKTIQRLLDSLPKVDQPVVIIDDHSDKPLQAYEVSHPGLTIIRPETKGYFTGAVNRGIKACYTDVLILNQDTYFTGRGWLEWLFDAPQNGYDLIGEGITGNHPAWPAGYIHGTFMYISRRVIEAIGLLNETDYPLWGSTCEYQLRACRAGFRALPLPTIPDFHHRDTKQQRFGDAINTALEREPGRKQEFIRTPPEISVIIPCYNYGRYLPDAINSLMAQTFQSFEVVIVDDASTDNSKEIIQGLADPWKGIRAVYLKQNLGTAGAINAGIDASYGRYIAILSADDMMKPERLENFYRLQLKNPHSFIYDDLVLFGSTAERLNGAKRVDGEELLLKLPPYDFEELLMKNGIHAGIFYPKAAWQETGGYPVAMGRGREDWAFNVALGLKGWCGVKCETPGYLYRREGQNRTVTNTDPISRLKFFGQMLALYPDAYRGGRPMGCCGSNSKNGAKAAAPVSGGGIMAMALPGAKDGWEIIEYIGTNDGTTTWYGPVSRQRYRFGKAEPIKPVIKADVEKMVALVDQGKPVFRIYQKPAEELKVEVAAEDWRDAVPAETEVDKVKREFALSKAMAGIDSTLPGEEPKSDYATSLPFDPAGLSVSRIKNRVGSLSSAEVERLLKAERNGLNRKGAIAAFEDALNA